MNRREFIIGTGTVPLATTILPAPFIPAVGYPDHLGCAYNSIHRAMAHLVLAAKAETQLETSAQLIAYSDELMYTRICCIEACKSYNLLKQAREEMGVHTHVQRPFLTDAEARAVLRRV